MFARLHACSSHPGTSRLIVNFQNSLWRPLLKLVRVDRVLKALHPENSWLASSDVLNLLRLAGCGNPV